MNDFMYYNPVRVHFGADAMSHLPEELGKFGANVLLTYGGGSIKRTGLYDRVLDALRAAGKSVYELSGIMPNPRTEKVYEGIELCRKHKIDLILAVGGGRHHAVLHVGGIVGVLCADGIDGDDLPGGDERLGVGIDEKQEHVRLSAGLEISEDLRLPRLAGGSGSVVDGAAGRGLVTCDSLLIAPAAAVADTVRCDDIDGDGLLRRHGGSRVSGSAGLCVGSIVSGNGSLSAGTQRKYRDERKKHR